MSAVFSLWVKPRYEMMLEFIRQGFRVFVTCADNSVLEESFMGGLLTKKQSKDA